MSRIEIARLCAEQSARLRQYRQRWEGIRTSTARADREAAEAGVRAAYTAGGLRPPQRIVWCDGPLDVVRSCTDACLADAGENVKSSVVDNVVREAAYAVDSRVSREVRSQIAATFGTRPVNPVSASVMAAITLDAPNARSQRFAGFRRLVQRVRGTMLPRWMEASFRENSFSQHDAPSLGVFEYVREACGLEKPTDAVMGLCAVARNVGWIMPHRRICWLVERPTLLKTDDRGRLHGPKGPAIRFADDWSFYAWKGVALPSWMIEKPEEITPRRVDRERDPIVRRCMIEIMTPERYIREGDAVAISEDDAGVLWCRTWSSWDAWTAVEVVNGTPEPDGTHRHYFLQVPPTVRTARQAVAWTYGLTELEYRALRLRT